MLLHQICWEGERERRRKRGTEVGEGRRGRKREGERRGREEKRGGREGESGTRESEGERGEWRSRRENGGQEKGGEWEEGGVCVCVRERGEKEQGETEI